MSNSISLFLVNDANGMFGVLRLQIRSSLLLKKIRLDAATYQNETVHSLKSTVTTPSNSFLINQQRYALFTIHSLNQTI